MTTTYTSNGKLLITAEYAVLDGAKALALPTKYGQSLSVSKTQSNNSIHWKSYDHLGKIWFENTFYISGGGTITSKKECEISKRLLEIFNAVKQLNPNFISELNGSSIETHQDFNRLWGLGTSSTLINNIANWAGVDAYKLLERTFGGSGYDIACAKSNSSLLFQKNKKRISSIPVDFNPAFKDHLYFVYLNQKQDSRAGILNYKNLNRINTEIINQLNKITETIINCEHLEDFNSLIEKHETIISNLIDIAPVKERLFKDFYGSIKSLGAWGGDFILAASDKNPIDYFKDRGFFIVIPYSDMVL